MGFDSNFLAFLKHCFSISAIAHLTLFLAQDFLIENIQIFYFLVIIFRNSEIRNIVYLNLLPSEISRKLKIYFHEMDQKDNTKNAISHLLRKEKF